MTAVIASSKAKPLAEQWKGEITSGRHQYFCDEPEKLEGHDQGPAPYDLLTGSLAACTLITLRMYAKHKDYDLVSFRLKLIFIPIVSMKNISSVVLFLKSCRTKSFNKKS